MLKELNDYIALNNNENNIEQNASQNDNEEYQIDPNVDGWLQENQKCGHNSKKNYNMSEKENFFNGNLTNQQKQTNCVEFDELFGGPSNGNAYIQKQNNVLKPGIQNYGGINLSEKNTSYQTQSKPQKSISNANSNLMDIFS